MQSHLPDAVPTSADRFGATSVQLKSNTLVIALWKVAVCSTVSAKHLSVMLEALGGGLYDIALLQTTQCNVGLLWYKKLKAHKHKYW